MAVCVGGYFRFAISALTAFAPGAEIARPASGIILACGIRFRKVLFGYFLFKEKVTSWPLWKAVVGGPTQDSSFVRMQGWVSDHPSS